MPLDVHRAEGVLSAAARRELEEELHRRLDQEGVNPVWLALHIGCAANALEITGRIEPRREEPPPQDP